jgi:hypothetical protein
MANRKFIRHSAWNPCLEALAREGISANGNLDRLLKLQANPRYEQRKTELMAELMDGESGPEAPR